MAEGAGDKVGEAWVALGLDESPYVTGMHAMHRKFEADLKTMGGQASAFGKGLMAKLGFAGLAGGGGLLGFGAAVNKLLGDYAKIMKPFERAVPTLGAVGMDYKDYLADLEKAGPYIAKYVAMTRGERAELQRLAAQFGLTGEAAKEFHELSIGAATGTEKSVLDAARALSELMKGRKVDISGFEMYPPAEGWVQDYLNTFKAVAKSRMPAAKELAKLPHHVIDRQVKVPLLDLKDAAIEWMVEKAAEALKRPEEPEAAKMRGKKPKGDWAPRLQLPEPKPQPKPQPKPLGLDYKGYTGKIPFDKPTPQRIGLDRKNPFNLIRVHPGKLGLRPHGDIAPRLGTGREMAAAELPDRDFEKRLNAQVTKGILTQEQARVLRLSRFTGRTGGLDPLLGDVLDESLNVLSGIGKIGEGIAATGEAAGLGIAAVGGSKRAKEALKRKLGAAAGKAAGKAASWLEQMPGWSRDLREDSSYSEDILGRAVGAMDDSYRATTGYSGDAWAEREFGGQRFTPHSEDELLERRKNTEALEGLTEEVHQTRELIGLTVGR